MKANSIVRGCVTIRVSIVFASLMFGLLLSCALSPLLRAQALKPLKPIENMPIASQAAQPTRAVRETWRKSLVQKPLSKKGCFKASYPSTEWQEVPCTKAPERPYPPAKGKRPETVGNGTDFSAQVTSGHISSAEGSFNSVTGVTSASSDTFSLQLNTSPFSTSVCNGHAGCQGWQQYVYSNSGVVFIQYWLLNYNATCPSGWNTYGGDCWENGPSAASVPVQPITNLVNITLTGTANAGGMDNFHIAVGSDIYSGANEDNILNLAQGWTTAEYNIFGDGGGSGVSFNSGSTIVVKTSVNNGTANSPSCVEEGFTGETNNLNLVNPCCPYGGPTPNIQFMQTNAGHTAVCGSTHLIGDPHITTADGKLYNFQGAGEYVSLLDSDGAEIQTRETPVPTSTTLNQPPQDLGLVTCVSLNTAVAARVGTHRVTYEPNFSGAYDSSGLQLRIDGKVTTLGPQGVNLGDGGRVTKSSAGNGIEIYFPDGKTLSATQAEYASMWYLNVDIFNVGLVSGSGGTDYLGGLAGTIPAGSWIPAMPNGASVGAMPPNLHDRYVTLYDKFGAAWRVTNGNSLFDYAPGTSTATFTNTDWPKESPPCTVTSTKATKIQLKVAEPVSAAVAEEACKSIADANLRSNCVADVQVTGQSGFAEHYAVTERVHTNLNIVKPVLLKPRTEIQ
ncbi:MAG: hypothetical protein ACLPXT_03840 [Terracidiphilus sp.]